jgi:hypothetical protein
MCAATRELQGSFVTAGPGDITISCSPACNKAFGTQVTAGITGHFRLVTPLLSVFTGGADITFLSNATADVIKLPAAAGAPSAPPSPSPSPSPSPNLSPSPGVSPSPSPQPSPSPSPSPTCAAPVANFSTTQQNKNKPVVFSSGGTSPTSGQCAITFWRWEYGDGETDAGNLTSTSHDYPLEGHTYQATLSVTNPGGTTSVTLPVTTK